MKRFVALFLMFAALVGPALAQDTPTPTETATVTATSTRTPQATATQPPRAIHYFESGHAYFRGWVGILSGGLIIGSGGSGISKSVRSAIALDIASVTGATCLDTTVNMTGVATGSECVMGLPTAPTANLMFSCFVSATDVATIRACNVTADPIDPASATYSIRTFAP